MWGIGTEHTLLVKPVFGEPRQRRGVVFKHDRERGKTLLEVTPPAAAKGRPEDFPYTVERPTEKA